MYKVFILAIIVIMMLGLGGYLMQSVLDSQLDDFNEVKTTDEIESVLNMLRATCEFHGTATINVKDVEDLRALQIMFLYPVQQNEITLEQRKGGIKTVTSFVIPEKLLDTKSNMSLYSKEV